MKKILLLLFIVPNCLLAQTVDETIQLDTISESINVIFKPTITNPTTKYSKKIGVFANDTSQIAIEKTFIRGKLNGIYKVYYPSGKPMVKAVMVEGAHNGEFTWYNENGIIKIKGIYKYNVKHGFWAYKYLKIYGKYKNGKKHGRWYKVDANNQKIKSWYKEGKLVKGKGFETDELNPSQIDSTNNIVVNNHNNTDSISNNVGVFSSINNIDKIEQVVYYLKNNFVLKKTLKAHFGEKTNDLLKFKKNYKSEVFQFDVCSTILPLDIDHFINKSKDGDILVSSIDSTIKNTSNIAQKFTNKEEIVYEQLKNYKSQVTKKDPLITVYFSEVIHNLMRVEIVWNKDEKEFKSDLEQLQLIESDKKFSILLYFNEKGNLTGAEYQKD